MVNLLYIALGGALGATLRYGVSLFATRVLGDAFPWGTLAVNLLGCYVIGLLWALADAGSWRTETSAFVFTGVLGAFTTFSTFGLEGFQHLRAGHAGLALLYLGGSVVLGLALVYLGVATARLALRPG